ncbi:hypothetical protein MAPG_02311 [Magnaporthiopsis poae ATCC 64411]|uniref:Protein CMS1 n=1 Tax=Magnaporthiopsis poae (strain ATCC 64411 / 73-15) TaxID=644358 RepID=A0A0C4DR12_MAGP6|nr:hypothetical protein MAPG_02311 [Magnaporthiopsis poae ATCC 64411]
MSAAVRSSVAKPKKRKAAAIADDGDRNAARVAPSGRDKKKKRKKNRTAGEDEGNLDLDAGLNLALANMDGQLLSDHLAQQVSRFGTDLSSVELADLHVPAGAIRDSSSFGKGPRSLENLPTFLEAFASGGPAELGAAPKDKGAPHTIVVAGAGLRAADLTRALRKYQKKGNTVAKLFAKHIKMEEAVSFLQKNHTGVAVGTPVRLMDLLDNGALSVKNLKRIVVDASHIDQKKRGVMDMRETALPLARWLTRPEFKERYVDDENPLHLLFY